ncbi:hypothetical protein [Niabella aurantiaca]|uniref:hypothetical protein n=1 Tax=Niabella aurantiaca TaxID=379900 RepID=UPI00035C8C3D|nr:hypothetical protein [Niabella aurantiaca]
MTERLPSIDRPHTTKDSPEVGISDKLDNFPINEAEYRLKTDFTSYFRLVGVPYPASEKFHVKILNRDIRGALMAVRRYLSRAGRVGVFRHLVNAVERLDGRKVYIRRKKGPKKSSGVAADVERSSKAFSEKQKTIKQNAKSFIERMRAPVFTVAEAKRHIAALR